MMYEVQNTAMLNWLSGKSPEQRHFVALTLNWDFAGTTLDWLVTRPDCDLATAVELFWRAEPSEMIEFATKDALLKEAAYYEWPYDFVGGIVRRATSGFYNRDLIAYDTSAFKEELSEYSERQQNGEKLAWKIPDTFAIAHAGVSVNLGVPSSEFWSEDLRPLFAALGSHFGVPITGGKGV